MYNIHTSDTPLVICFCYFSLYHLPITIAAQYRSPYIICDWCMMWQSSNNTISFWFIIHLFYFYLSDQPIIEGTLQSPINLHFINRAVNATLTTPIICPVRPSGRQRLLTGSHVATLPHFSCYSTLRSISIPDFSFWSKDITRNTPLATQNAY